MFEAIEVVTENVQPAVRIRELTFRTPDPASLADVFEKLLGLTRLRHDVDGDVTAIIMTDGYLQLAMTSAGTSGRVDASPAMDHIGIQVQDVVGACAALTTQGWVEAGNSTPATRFMDGPEGLQLEIRSPGWGFDDIIRASTQLYDLVPAHSETPLIHLDRTDTKADDDGFVRVARISDIPPGRGARVEVGEEAIFVAELDGTYYAVQDSCPHLPRFGRVSEGQRAGRVLECPIHRSRFDLLDGSVLEPPAKRPLKCFEVVVRDEEVMVRVT